jgi:alcohol dehydrogenase class IV
MLYDELAPFVAGRSGAEALIEEVEAIIADTGLPTSLKDANVPETDLPMLAEDAMLHQRLLVNNPRDVSQQDALEIYSAAY